LAFEGQTVGSCFLNQLNGFICSQSCIDQASGNKSGSTSQTTHAMNHQILSFLQVFINDFLCQFFISLFIFWDSRISDGKIVSSDSHFFTLFQLMRNFQSFCFIFFKKRYQNLYVILIFDSIEVFHEISLPVSR